MKKLSNFKKIIFFIAPFLLISIYLLIFLQSKTIYFKDKKIVSRPFIESEGNSSILADSISVNRLFCRYKIGNEENPRLGIGIEKSGDNDFFNIKGLDYIEIELNPDSTDNLNLCLLFNIKEFTLQNLWWTNLYKSSEISIRPGKKRYRIPIKELHTPVWWYSKNRISSDEIIHRYDLSRLKAIVFTNHDLSPRGFPQEIDIRKITFKRNLFPIFKNLILIIFIYSIIIYLIFTRKRKVKRLAYEKIPIKSNEDLDLKAISEFIGRNYHNHNLSQNEVVSHTGIPAYKVREIIKKHYNHTFKQHITDLRITEAKRLIKTTDRQIIEIAQCVGYKHISTFNQVFKKETNLTPLEYRDKNPG